ncbi:DUF7455 domain-containing protein [Arthrobacter terrae]|nr:hypothetical protein [Arthrobacter terrae]
MTTETLTKPLSKLADQLNAHLETQPPERALSLLDRCDRCIQHARASFVFTIPADPEGTGKTETDVLLCGHHTRMHLPALLAKGPVSYWIEPQQLMSIRGVNVDRKNTAKTGDGLTGA